MLSFSFRNGLTVPKWSARLSGKYLLITSFFDLYFCYSRSNFHLGFADLQQLSNEEVRKKRSAIFTREKQRQKDTILRLEKIRVDYKGIPEDTTLVLNKWMSTPYNVAQRKFGRFYLVYLSLKWVFKPNFFVIEHQN